MKQTKWYKFFKPERTELNNDTADIEVINRNSDSTDSILHNHADELIRLEADKATKAALAAHTDNTENPHALSKAQLGLSNVDNTADINKPLSTPQKKYVDESVQAAGGGDMLKSVYDTNNDGVVDAAHSLKGGEW